MTAVSLINPYAPQPTPAPNADAGGVGTVQAVAPLAPTTSSGGATMTSDHSGQRANDPTGTGGAQIDAMLKKGREAMEPQNATPKSVIDAQTDSGPTTAFLAREAQRRTEARADAATRAADRATMEAKAAQEDARKAAEPDYVMPNPLPTAQILERGDA